MTSLKNAESTSYSLASDLQLEFRDKLWNAFKNAPMSEPELERCLGNFVRASLLARFLAIDDVYRRIIDVPGYIFDIGCWRGQTSILCENLRAIYEPLNEQRRIVAFDTFQGYRGVGDRDRPTKSYNEGTYAVGHEYAKFLKELFEVHEGNNALPHLRGRHSVVVGDATDAVPNFFKDKAGAFVALAFFDLGLYEPTKAVLTYLLDQRKLLPGSVLGFYQLTQDELLPGDGIAFQEVFHKKKFVLGKSRYYPTLSIVTVKE